MLLNNRYQILRTLGSGGFGETFIAEDRQMPSGQRCVVKRLRPISNDPKAYQMSKERFQREAAVLEDLGKGSDQIPTLYAYFEEDNNFYLVQELIEGQTLGEIAQKQGNFSEAYVKDFLTSLVSVLDYVHSKRIIHRDINPNNIIVRQYDSKPVLIDFGAVKESMTTTITTSGTITSSVVVGTNGFMPSEQAAGRPVYSSDLYAAGLTAIYLLTGKLPQDIEADNKTGAILWKRYAPTVSPTLTSILNKAVNPYSKERYSTAQEILQALQQRTVQTSIKPEPTVVVSPGNVISPNNSQVIPSISISNLGNLQKTLVAGIFLIGAITLGWWMAHRNPQTATNVVNSPSLPSPSPSPPVSPSPSLPSPPPSPSPSYSPSPSPLSSSPPVTTTPAADPPPPSISETNNRELDRLATTKKCIPPNQSEYIYANYKISWNFGSIQHEGLLRMKGREGRMRIKYFNPSTNKTETVDQTMVLASCTSGLVMFGFNPVVAGTNTTSSTYIADNLIIRREINGNVIMINSDDKGNTILVEIEEITVPSSPSPKKS